MSLDQATIVQRLQALLADIQASVDPPPVIPPAILSVSMAGTCCPPAPSIVDTDLNVWSVAPFEDTGESGQPHLLTKNGQLVTEWNGISVPGGIAVWYGYLCWTGHSLVYGGYNFHFYERQANGSWLDLGECGANNTSDHNADFAFPFAYDSLPDVPVITPPGSSTIFTTQVPTGFAGNNAHQGSSDADAELGTMFHSDRPLLITHLRFFKAGLASPFDQKPEVPYHTGRLWDAQGNLLAERVYRRESGSGWQEVELDVPVAIQAGEDYVVSTTSWASQCYTQTDGLFPIVNGPLTATAGVFGPLGQRPTQTTGYVHGSHQALENSCFFRDVVCRPDGI